MARPKIALIGAGQIGGTLAHLAAINLGTAGPLDTTLQTALASAGAFIAFTPEDNVRFAGSLDATDLAARLAPPPLQRSLF